MRPTGRALGIGRRTFQRHGRTAVPARWGADRLRGLAASPPQDLSVLNAPQLRARHPADGSEAGRGPAICPRAINPSFVLGLEGEGSITTHSQKPEILETYPGVSPDPRPTGPTCWHPQRYGLDMGEEDDVARPGALRPYRSRPIGIHRCLARGSLGARHRPSMGRRTRCRGCRPQRPRPCPDSHAGHSAPENHVPGTRDWKL